MLVVNDAQAINIAPSDTSKNILDKGKIQVAMAKARTMFLENDVRGALQEYKNILIDDPKNAACHFRVGECQYSLQNYPQAEEALIKAKGLKADVNKELDYMFGMVYHQMEKYDEAIKHYEAFSATLTSDKQFEEYQVRVYIEQCQYGKELTAKPVDVKITNMGRNINSRHPDYAPILSPDGKKLFITARRPDTKGGMRSDADHKFYEDIYVSKWDDENNTWGELESIPGKVNTEFFDAATCISADGEYLYLSQNIAGYTKSSDIMFTKISSSGKWGKPKRIEKPINTSYFESSATITGDGNTMYFITERPTGIGRGDIWKVEKISKREWGEPILVENVNTEEDENTVWVHPDGKYLFFSSKGHKGMGGYDIFRSELIDGKWSVPMNLGYPINTVGHDLHFSCTSDGKMGFLSAVNSKGIGDRDVYKIDLSNYPVLSPDFANRTHGTISGTILDGDGKAVSCTVAFYNKANGEKVREVETDAKGGYKATLPGNVTYEIKSKPEGFSEATDEVELTLKDRGETVMVKHLIVKKL